MPLRVGLARGIGKALRGNVSRNDVLARKRTAGIGSLRGHAMIAHRNNMQCFDGTKKALNAHERSRSCLNHTFSAGGMREGMTGTPEGEVSGEGAEEEASLTDDDTIAAIVTPVVPQAGSVGIVRLSGEDALAIASCVFSHGKPASESKESKSKSFEKYAKSHRVYYGSAHGREGEVLDEVLCVPMLSPKSFTAEDVVEINCHGGSVCSQRVLRACIENGARFARPGEFTLRAFLNGRLDLTQAESVQSLVSARTTEAAETALESLKGGLGSTLKGTKAEVDDLISELDARVDFDDELPPLDPDNIVERAKKLEGELADVLKTAERGRLMDTGITVAIVGKPNVGKSSLLNAWSRSDRAIVTEVPGTTRDVVDVSVSVHGIAVSLLDTAGIRADPNDTVETIGVERSRVAAMGADILLMVVDARGGWTEGDDEILNRVVKVNDSVPALLAVNKADAASYELPPDEFRSEFSALVRTSAIERSGIGEVEDAILQCLGCEGINPEGAGWAVNQRQAEALIRARDALQRLRGTVEQDLPFDFWTIELREAARAIGQVTGDDVTEDVLDNIFSKFCIGK